jgi:hypothetical protein
MVECVLTPNRVMGSADGESTAWFGIEMAADRGLTFVRALTL